MVAVREVRLLVRCIEMTRFNFPSSGLRRGSNSAPRSDCIALAIESYLRRLELMPRTLEHG